LPIAFAGVTYPTMLPAYRVRLVEHDEHWGDQARQEEARLIGAAEGGLVSVQHVGSTSIPGIKAKPIIDLLGIAPDSERLDSIRPAMEALGYVWQGEYGVPGRRFYTLSDPESGQRKVHLHCYAEGDPSIRRHLAFRDYLRARPELADEYEQMKSICATKHPNDSHAYTLCKDEWITRVEAEALKNR
jgi:GrpB-like predicted nucleotidyltransferase (UPF0157 family)